MMRRRLAAALLLAGVVASGCTQGFVLEDGERPPAELTDAKFVFAEGETEIDMRPAPTNLEPTPTPEPTATLTNASTRYNTLGSAHAPGPFTNADWTHCGGRDTGAHRNGQCGA